jgi:hypothetical protein
VIWWFGPHGYCGCALRFRRIRFYPYKE